MSPKNTPAPISERKLKVVMQVQHIEEADPEQVFCQQVLMPMVLSLTKALKREDLMDTIRQLGQIERLAFEELMRRIPRPSLRRDI